MGGRGGPSPPPNSIAAEWPSGRSRIRREDSDANYGLHQMERDMHAPTMESGAHPSFSA